MSKLKNSKIIVTGGLGFLGQHIVKELSKSNLQNQILILARTNRKLWIFDKKPKNIRIIKNVNLEEINKFEEIFEKGDILVHNASLISYKKSDREKIFASNYEATKKLLKICFIRKVKRVILISSISAVGLNNLGATDETFYPNKEEIQNDNYALSKLLSEEEILKYNGRMNYLILNPSVIIGPGSVYISRLIKLISVLPIIPNVKAINSFVDVRDVAHAVVLAIKSQISGERFIVTTTNIDTERVFCLLANLLGKKSLIVNIPPIFIYFFDFAAKILLNMGLYPFTKMPASFLIDKSYSSTKLRKTLGWVPKFNIKKSLADSVKYSKI